MHTCNVQSKFLFWNWDCMPAKSWNGFCEPDFTLKLCNKKEKLLFSKETCLKG